MSQSTPKPADASANMPRESDGMSLTHAMQTADKIRRHYNEDTTKTRSLVPPGVLQGASMFVFTGLALLPVRRVILNQSNSHQAFRNFMDLVVSVGHVLAATQVGLIAGSLYGCKSHLDDFAKSSSITKESSVADAICQDLWKSVLPANLHQRMIIHKGAQSHDISSSSWDPRVQTMISLQEVVTQCQHRGVGNS